MAKTVLKSEEEKRTSVVVRSPPLTPGNDLLALVDCSELIDTSRETTAELDKRYTKTTINKIR